MVNKYIKMFKKNTAIFLLLEFLEEMAEKKIRRSVENRKRFIG